jgi:hypothetical protein
MDYFLEASPPLPLFADGRKKGLYKSQTPPFRQGLVPWARSRRRLTGLLGRPDVRAVYAQISELDPGEGCWPFTDTVLVAGTIAADVLREAVAVLQPDEVGAAEQFGVSPSIGERHGCPVMVVWWD